MNGNLLKTFISLIALIISAGCGDISSQQQSPRSDETNTIVLEKWGMPLNKLPHRKLVLISPHNENIQKEFAWAFSDFCAVEHGFRVDFEWRDVGGGGNTIRDYLLNVYSRADSASIDILWGGGEPAFISLTEAGVFEKIDLSEETAAAIPAVFGGIAMYDREMRWYGSAVSGFGFLCNVPRLRQSGCQVPSTWDDLATPQYNGAIALADPTQSGSIAAVYEMIVQSEKEWPDGWAKLLRVLANAKLFYDGAGDAANAPLIGEALIAACIDFYGALRVEQAPGTLVYVSPKGQTAFTPDPIAKLKNPPNPDLADLFIAFVLSSRGQALLALPVGDPHGPMRHNIGRQPIRRDVYNIYAGRLLPWIINPYETGNEMIIDAEIQKLRFNVLRQLVRAAAIDNRTGLRDAYAALIRDKFPPLAVSEFASLPANVATIAAIREVAQELANQAQAEKIVTDWQQFFRRKYANIVNSSASVD